MTTVTIPFDGNPSTFAVPDRNLAEILSPKPSTPLSDLERAINEALEAPIDQDPLEKWVKPDDRVIIVSDDITRLTPADRIIPPLLERLHAAQDSGRAVVDLVRAGITARRIITLASLENAVRLTSAIGGSTNAALHIPAIAYEAGVAFDINRFDDISRSTPLVAKMNPAAACNVIDFYESGGVPVVMHEIASLLHKEAMTVTGRTIGENIRGHASPDNEVIKTFENPFSASGGLAVLHGNLAPDSAVTKPAAIRSDMLTFSGPARVFDSEAEANAAIMTDGVRPGDVIFMAILPPFLYRH